MNYIIEPQNNKATLGCDTLYCTNKESCNIVCTGYNNMNLRP
ncbi:hypothetical protein [Clostridium sp. 'deep sea']|nr:hypothetical protein [Clostridium sp. 'deep sea']